MGGMDARVKLLHKKLGASSVKGNGYKPRSTISTWITVRIRTYNSIRVVANDMTLKFINYGSKTIHVIRIKQLLRYKIRNNLIII